MLSLYIHIPFCSSKCPYCGFYSTHYTPAQADGFLAGIRTEADSYRDLFIRTAVETVYIGGGTPTVLSREQMQTLMAVIRDHVSVTEKTEFTVEANPNSTSLQKLEVMLMSGVNRLSIGVQSFSEHLLRGLGRLHTVHEAIASYGLARDAGFRNISMDLIYGIPGQTQDDWRMNLTQAIACAPEHISLYSLSLDEDTPFTHWAAEGRLRLPGDETVAQMYETGASLLAAAGYDRYEISNFARPGHACRHNMHYWARGEYLGLGPGAWSFIAGKRHANIRDAGEYCIRLADGESGVEYREVLRPDDASAEAVMLGLRTSAGIDLQRFETQYGRTAFERLLSNSRHLCERRLLSMSNGCVRLTDRGILVSDDVIAGLCS